jgi:hypothetical protein
MFSLFIYIIHQIAGLLLFVYLTKLSRLFMVFEVTVIIYQKHS